MRETFLGIDYPTLWYLVTGALFSGYAILDGFDFGAGAWHLFLNKERSRRVALNAIGPVWDGNEVWLVIGGGALFAGFPVFYATFLSSLYVPFMLFLVTLIFRAIAIEFRSKEEMSWWKKMWDVTYSVSSISVAVLLGVVLGNVLQGISIEENYHYVGDGFFDFLNPYSILVGLVTLCLFMTHGGLYLLLKTDGKIYSKFEILVKKSLIAFIVLFSMTTVYTLIYIPHLSDKFKQTPALFIVPVLAFLAIANIPRLVTLKKYLSAFIFSSITISLLLIIVAIELYPTLLISTIDPKFNIDIYNAASSDKSLGIMLLFVVIGAPLVAGYTIFVYKTFKGKVKLDEFSY